MELGDFDRWMRRYGLAWEARDGEAFCSLFSDDARYHWTPMDDPKCGQLEILAAFEDAVSRQSDIHFSHTVLAVTETGGIARWKCRFRRIPSATEVRIDGVLTARMTDHGLCREFREWWHSSEKEREEDS